MEAKAQSKSENAGTASLLLLLLFLLIFTASSRTGAAEELDVEQAEIAQITTDAIVARIKKLATRFPELSEFGKSPYFEQWPAECLYLYKITEVKSPEGRKVAQVQRGGCGIYIRFSAGNSKETGRNPLVGPWSSSGGKRAGMSHNFAVAVFNEGENGSTPLADEVRRVMEDELQGTFAKLTSELVVKRSGNEIKPRSLLALLENGKPEIRSSAMKALQFQTLTADQLERIRQLAAVGKLNPDLVWETLELVSQQDDAHLPEVMASLLTHAITAEVYGTDTFSDSPFFRESGISEARATRESLLGRIEQDSRLRFAGLLLTFAKSDPFTDNRIRALELFGEKYPSEAALLFPDLLADPNRSIQIFAADWLGKKQDKSVVEPLRKLLRSCSSRVRKSALEALRRMGLDAQDPGRQPLTPEGYYLIEMMERYGARDEDLLEVALHFDNNGSVRDKELAKRWESDNWKMEEVSAEAVRELSARYAAGVRASYVYGRIGAIGPLLLVAASRLEQVDLCELIYERICDEFSTDAEALEQGLTGIAWLRFTQGLDYFQNKKDADALEMFRAAATFDKVARPYSVLSHCSGTSIDLIPDVESRLAAKVETEPAFEDREKYIRYWIARIREINGVMPGQPAKPDIWSDSEISILPFASNKLREVGVDALPALIEVFGDKRPTRSVGYWRDFYPSRYVVSVGDAAQEIFAVICIDYGLSRPERTREKHPALEDWQAELRGWLKDVPKDARRLSPEERSKFISERYPPKSFIDSP